MNNDEFAFFNQQLAIMLRDGIPLEGAVKQLASGMASGSLRSELQELEADLSRGSPLPEAIRRRSLPAFYLRMLEIGVRGNDLPGVLTLMADHFHRANALWNRLKGLLVYPLIVIVVSLGLTLLVSLAFTKFLSGFFESLVVPVGVPIAVIWIPPVFLGLGAVAGIWAVCNPALRARLRWRLPAFREASLAEFASAMALMLRGGTTLPEALAMAEQLEAGTSASFAIARWRVRVESGKGKPADWLGLGEPFPPLFLWLIQSAGEDIAAGFLKASEVYHDRASYRIEMALFGALPVSILLIGQMVFWQAAPLLQALIRLMNLLGDTGNGGHD
jgi:type II secretory pathway component PulF